MPKQRITNDWVLERFGEIYPVYRLSFARLLVILRREFDGDLDAMLVLLTLSLGTQREDWREALFGDMPGSAPLRLTNTQSIAQATGIPRESVRRKLATMQAKGWITRDANNHWTPTKKAAEDLRQGSLETVSFLRAVIAAAPEA